MKTWLVTYRLCDRVYDKVVVARDDLTAWLLVFRSHTLGSELLDIQEVRL